MSSTQEGKLSCIERTPVRLAPPLGDVRTESDADAALGRPASILLLGVRPKELHHEAVVTRLLAEPLNLADVVERNLVPRREPTMDDKVPLAALGRQDGRRRRCQRRQRCFAPRWKGRRNKRTERQRSKDIGEEVVCGQRMVGQCYAASYAKGAA